LGESAPDPAGPADNQRVNALTFWLFRHGISKNSDFPIVAVAGTQSELVCLFHLVTTAQKEYQTD
jgi:hypothetical protein